jgi:signal transduction histidine kinase
MSILDILRLVGYTTGTALLFFLIRLLLRRQARTETEWTIFLLIMTTGLWHLGNMLRTLYDVLGLEGPTMWPRTAESIAFVGLGMMPPVLLHYHTSALRSARGDPATVQSRLLTVLLYLPMPLIPLAVASLLTGPYQPPLQKLSSLIIPFTLWDTGALWLSAFLAIKLSRRSTEPRERRFYRTLANIWLAIGAAMLVTFALGARTLPVIGPYLETGVGLSSILPAALLAYYIYRYHYLEIIIRKSFVYAIFASLIVIVYMNGIRTLDQYVHERLGLTAGTVEALMILALVFAAGPVARFIDRTIEQLFASEIGVYRQVAERISEEAIRYGTVPELVRYIEATVGHALELPSVRIILAETRRPLDVPEAAFNDLLASLRQLRLRFLDHHPSLEPLAASCCAPLWHEDQLVGIILVKEPPPLLTSSKRAALPVLAAQIAIAIKNCQLIEEKMKLEEQLVERERLALLGQVAATIAHQVKNPLSSIKTIVQVMQEDEQLRSEYQRDLDLIVKEIDRLNRTVTQLLSFSRPSAPSGERMTLQHLIQQVVNLLSSEAHKADVRLRCQVDGDLTLTGQVSTAMTEVISNLILNAIQATPAGGEVAVVGTVVPNGQQPELRITVTDDGEGIAPEFGDRVFDPFFTTRQRGTGLGLTIVKRRLTDIGGVIRIESPVGNGRGTRVTVSVPIHDSSVIEAPRDD